MATGVVVVLGYLAVSLICWQHLLVAGVSNHLYALNLGDVGQGVWFIGWLPFAFGHGLNPFVSHYMFAPKGFNLLTNTNFFLEALLLAPLTAATSPLVSFNVACIAAPVISAGTLYWVLRRYEIGRLAAFAAGLVYGFAPAILQADRIGHFNLTWMFFPPLLVYLLDRIFFRQAGSPLKLGALLGALVIAQFFSSPEILLDCVVVAAPVLAVVIACRPGAIRTHLRFALVASVTAIVLAGAVLAYPLAVYVGGPQHVAYVNASVTPGAGILSPVWPAEPVGTGFLEAPPGTPWTHRFDGGFIGPVVLVAALGALALARRRKVVIVLWGAAVWSFVLSWGSAAGYSGNHRFGWHAPAFYLARWLPILRNVGWIRLSVLTDCCLAVLAAIGLDEFIRAVSARRAAAGRAAAVGLGALACVPVVLASNVPFTGFAAVTTPSVLANLPGGANRSALVADVSPIGGTFSGMPLAWQAQAGYPFESVFGYAWHPAAGSAIGTVDEPTGVLEYIVVKAPVTRPDIVLSAAQRRTFIAAFHGQGIRIAAVVDGYPGSEQLTREYDQLFGPGRHAGDGEYWLVPQRR
jgi:hypothetical protein